MTWTTGWSWSTCAQLVGDRRVERLHHVARIAGSERRAQRGVALGREQDDLGDLGAERLDRAGEQPLERDDDLGRARQRAGRLVEELEALVALALGGVGAVGQEDGHERDDEQRQRAHVVGDDHGAGEPEARVRRRDGEVHREHAPERLRPDQALREGDRGADQDHGDDRRGLRGEQREDPDHRPEALDRAGEAAEDDHREAGRERELRDVEDELDRGQLAVEQQHHDRPDQAGEHEVHRRGEQQAEDERQVTQRERVGAAAEVQVDHAALGGEEAEGQAPPRDMDSQIELGQVVHRPHQQGGAGDDDSDIQRPDASCGRQDAQRALPWGHGWLIGGASASL